MPYDANGDWYDEEQGDTSGTDYSNEGKNYPTTGSTASSPVNSSSNSTLSPGLLDTLSKTITDPNVLAMIKAETQKKTATDLASQLKTAAVDNLAALANQIKSENVPDLSAYIARVQRAVTQGQIDPGQAMQYVSEQSKLKGIQVPKEFTDAQSNVVRQLATIAGSGGYSDIERAGIQKAINQTTTAARGEQGAIKDEFAQRGQYGAGNELVQRAIAAQTGSDRAAQQALDVEAAGQQRAIDALKSEGALSTTLNDQSFGQQAQVASAQDTINKLNAELQNTTALANAKAGQVASAGNIANAMDVQKTNMAQETADQQRALDAAKAEEEQKRQREALAVTAAGAAGSNAAKLFSAPYQAGQAAQGAANTASANSQSSTASDVAKYAGAAKTAYDLFSAWSDPKLKTDKKQMSDEEISDIFDQLFPTSFGYNKEGLSRGAPKGKVVGIMATDLEKTPGGADLVVDIDGKKAVDGQKAMSLALAAIASLSKRMKHVEDN